MSQIRQTTIVPPPYWKTKRPWGQGNDGETTGSGDENGVSFVFMDMRTTSRRWC